MEEITAALPTEGTELRTLSLELDEIEVRSESRREIAMRLVPWDVIAETPVGPEMWARGSLAHVDPAKVVLRSEHENPPAGRGISIDERDDGAYMTFRVSRTAKGDEILALAADGVTRGVSVGYWQPTSVIEMQSRGGRRARVVKRADLREVSTTWLPTWQQSAVLAVRSQQAEEGDPVAETTAPPAPDIAAQLTSALDGFAQRSTEQFQQTSAANAEIIERLTGRLDAIEERSRREAIIVPGRSGEIKKATIAEWMSVATRTLAGTNVSQRELQERALEDIVTGENPGLVPDAFVNELIGKIDEGRPFLNSTRRITAPATGMSLTVPVLTQRPTAAVQANEKTEIESTALKAGVRSFDGVTIAGGADVSIQMLRRADPSFSDLLISELQEAYARNADSQALATLFNAPTTPGTANIDPEDLEIGEAWTNSLQNSGRAPDTIWLSAAGVAAFIDAKNDGTNAPLYFNLNANFTVGGGPGGAVSALRPVYVPGLDGTGVDVMIGPSGGFVWAEDGTFTLQSDNPTLAGRDIAIVGILFFVPRYPAAFTTYDLGS